MIGAVWNRLQRAARPRGSYPQLADRCLARFAALEGKPLPASRGPRVGVVVTPWQETAVPFYLIEWAVRLRRDGVNVEFIWDVWPNVKRQPSREETVVLGLLQAISQRFQIPVVSPDMEGTAQKI